MAARACLASETGWSSRGSRSGGDLEDLGGGRPFLRWGAQVIDSDRVSPHDTTSVGKLLPETGQEGCEALLVLLAQDLPTAQGSSLDVRIAITKTLLGNS